MAGILLELADRGQEAELARLGVGLQMIERHLADAAGRFVDDAGERDVVARIEQQPQVGEDVLVFLAVEEGQAANDLIGNAWPE